MQFKYKLLAAFAFIGLLIVVLFGVQFYYLSLPANTAVGDYALDETFTQSSFLYGPQSWVPYASELPVAPSSVANSNSNNSFYIMFVDLNATSNLNATFPCVRIDYSFSGLHGTAAFHIYGYVKSNGGFSWTNRVEGSGASGFYVTTQPSLPNVLPNAQVMSSGDNICVKVSNREGPAYNDFGNDTYLMKFGKSDGGLNSLHITTDPKNPSGNITTTTNLSGTFYVDFTGSRVQDDFVLLVAVNGTIGSDFQLNLRAS